MGGGGEERKRRERGEEGGGKGTRTLSSKVNLDILLGLQNAS